MATYLPNVTDVLPDPSLYTPNFSYMDTMLRRRQGMYEQGFAQVSNAYNFVNRNVTNPYSVRVRDQFLSQARNNLKDLASLDLSQQQNVAAARNVFEPFIKNQPVLMDMAFTAHLDQQEAIAETYRLKDGGKEFSEDNLNFIRKQRAAFANDDISSVGNYYSNRRSFTPYYDWNKEFKEWFASYKPDKISIDTKDGLYKITEERGGASAEDLKLFFSSVASEKAKNQMRIESTVRLADNPEQLAGIYAGIAQKDISSIDNKLSSIDNMIKLSKNPSEANELKKQKKLLEDQKFELSSDVDKISRGDIGFIKNNADKLAFGIYFDQAVSRLGKGLSWTEYKKSFSADEVALARWKEAMADARQARSDDRADRRARWELEGLPMADGTFITLSSGEKDLLEKQDVRTTQQALDNISNRITSTSKALTLHVANQLQKDPKNIKWQDVIDYAKSDFGKRDKEYIRLRGEINEFEADERIYKSQIAAATNFADNKVGKKAIENAKNDFKSKVPKSAGGFTADEIFNAVKSGNYSLPAGAPTGQSVYVAGTSNIGSSNTVVNGKVVNTDNALVKEMIIKAEASLRGYKADYKKGMEDYFSSASYVNAKAIPLNQNSKNFKNLAGVLGGITGVDNSAFKQILAGGNNDAFFYVDNEQSRKDPATFFKGIETKLKFQGLEARYDAEKGLVYVKEKPGVSRVRLGVDLYQNYTPMERKLISFGNSQAGNDWMSTPFYPNNITTDKKGNPLPSVQFKVSSVDDRRMYYMYVEGQDTPFTSNSSLTDLMDETRNAYRALYERGYRGQ